jgi:hypothetical protein
MVPGDHGSEITQYSIEVDNGQGGDFYVTSDSLSMTAIVTEAVIAGTHYRFRYRAKNEIGFGPYSNTAYILTASAPVKPKVISISTLLDQVVITW